VSGIAASRVPVEPGIELEYPSGLRTVENLELVVVTSRAAARHAARERCGHSGGPVVGIPSCRSQRACSRGPPPRRRTCSCSERCFDRCRHVASLHSTPSALAASLYAARSAVGRLSRSTHRPTGQHGGAGGPVASRCSGRAGGAHRRRRSRSITSCGRRVRRMSWPGAVARHRHRGQATTVADDAKVLVIGDDAPPGGDTDRALLTSGALPSSKLDPSEVCCILYTSGSTAVPKGVQHSHETLLAGLTAVPADTSSRRWRRSLRTHRVAARTAASVVGRRHDGRDGRWSARAACALIEEHRLNTSAGTPFFLSTLLDEADRTGRDISSLPPVPRGRGVRAAALVERAEAHGHCQLADLRFDRAPGDQQRRARRRGGEADVHRRRVGPGQRSAAPRRRRRRRSGRRRRRDRGPRPEAVPRLPRCPPSTTTPLSTCRGSGRATLLDSTATAISSSPIG